MPKRKPSFNTIYISERVQECLRPIARCALTTVVAPMGYGKTTAINWFLAEKTKGGKAVAIRMSIYSEKLPMLWRSAQDAFRFAGLDVLSAFDFPTGEAAATLVLEELCRAFSSGKTAYYLFLDDFHLLRDERAVRFICRISARLPENAHLIVASRGAAGGRYPCIHACSASVSRSFMQNRCSPRAALKPVAANTLNRSTTPKYAAGTSFTPSRPSFCIRVFFIGFLSSPPETSGRTAAHGPPASPGTPPPFPADGRRCR